jgi:hypothetical protein
MTSPHICSPLKKRPRRTWGGKSAEFEYVLKAGKFTSENDDVVNENEDSEMNEEEWFFIDKWSSIDENLKTNQCLFIYVLTFFQYDFIGQSLPKSEIIYLKRGFIAE